MKKNSRFFVFMFFASIFSFFSNAQTISTFAGNNYGGFSGDGGMATAAAINTPHGVAIDGSDNLFIADTYNNRIQKVSTTDIISTIAGTGTGGYNGDGIAATAANLHTPYGIASDASGNIYIADYFNNRIRKVNTSGIISTIAGTGLSGFSGDGFAATSAELSVVICRERKKTNKK